MEYFIVIVAKYGIACKEQKWKQDNLCFIRKSFEWRINWIGDFIYNKKIITVIEKLVTITG